MQIIRNITTLRKVLDKARRQGKSIGFVPTMGYFHEGHLTLMRRAKKDNDICVVSIFVNAKQFGPQEDLSKYPRDFQRDSSLIKKENDITVLSVFVNPKQFGPKEDFKKYPRVFQRDKQLAQKEGTDIIFAPSADEMYPKNYLTSIEVACITNIMCGASRPGHFKGVATVVAKLLNIVQPHVMYLGQKDAQQVAVIKAMVRDLNFPVHIQVVATKREADGLAMSSRNVYLSAEDRRQAPVIYQALRNAQALLRSGERSAPDIIKAVRTTILTQPNAKIQYVACVDLNTLEPVKAIGGNILIAVAVFFSKTRLIDNVIIRLNKSRQVKS